MWQQVSSFPKKWCCESRTFVEMSKNPNFVRGRIQKFCMPVCSITISQIKRHWTRQTTKKAPILPKRDHLNYLNIH